MKINTHKFAKDLLDSMRTMQLIRRQKIGVLTVARELMIDEQDVYDALAQKQISINSQIRICAWMGKGYSDYNIVWLPKGVSVSK